MLPDPLHPAIVHIPIALAVMLPLFALCAAIGIRAGALPTRAWSGVVLLGGVLVASAWLALETGEREEERVEEVVAEAAIHTHEEAAEAFMVVSAVLALISLGGLAAGRPGAIARVASVVVSIALLASGIQVGSRGGALVYEHGAGQAYARDVAVGSTAAHRGGHEREREDHDD